MTRLNLEAPPKQPKPQAVSKCAKCGAGPEARVDASPFGPVRSWMCGVCGANA